MPIQVAAKIDDLRSRGQLFHHAGQIVAAVAQEDGLVRVRVALRGGRGEIALVAARIINCTGPETDLRKSDDPLIQDLLERGVVQVDAHGLGLLTDEIGALINSSGTAWRTLFTLGPARRGTLVESTAISEIRRQARTIASVLLNELSPGSSTWTREQAGSFVAGLEHASDSVGHAAQPQRNQ